MLLERQEPLQLLNNLGQRALQGRGNIALLGGEAGVGKTSLLLELKRQLPPQSRLLWGGCDALFTPRPLGPLHDMAGELHGSIREQLARGVQSSHLYSAVIAELETSDQGAVMVIEDAHWADHATLDLLKFIGRRISMLPVFLIISFRNDEVNDSHPLTRVFGELPAAHTSRLDLQCLSVNAVESLGVPPGYTLEDLYTITGGNPFFVTELLEYRHTPGSVLPASIKDAVAARLTNLSPGERELLETISVIPATVPMGVIKTLFPEQGETLAMACVGRNLLTQGEKQQLKFRHELARLANLARTSANKQKVLHAKVLKALLDHAKQHQISPPYDQLVHHAAGAFDSQRVLEFAPLAAKAAAAVGAHREAAAHLASALQFVNDAEPEVAAQLYEDWAYEAGVSQRIDDEVLEARRHAITLWRALNRQEKVGENLRMLSRLHSFRGEASEADYYADQAIKALESIPQSEQHAMACSLRSQLHMLNDRMDEAIAWGNKALELADECNSIEVKIHSLNNIGSAKAFRGNKEGVEELQLSLKLAIQEKSHEHAARVYTNLSEYGVEFCNFELAEKVLAEGTTFSIQNDLLNFSNYLVGRQALLWLEQGRLADAETIANGVLQSDNLSLFGRLPALSVLATARMRLDHVHAAEALAQALSSALSMDEFQFIVPIHLAMVESAWLDGDITKAKEHLRHLKEIGGNNMHCWRRGACVLWAYRLDYSLSKDFFHNIPTPHQTEIDGDNLAAAEMWRSLGLPHTAALTLMQTKERDHLSTALSQAQEILQSIGARKAINTLKGLAAANNVSNILTKNRRGPYKAAKNHPLGLTKREQQILALLTNGASNKEISETLSRSQRTVEHHVSSILSKMNASTRMEAMLRVHNEPWLLPKEKAEET